MRGVAKRSWAVQAQARVERSLSPDSPGPGSHRARHHGSEPELREGRGRTRQHPAPRNHRTARGRGRWTQRGGGLGPHTGAGPPASGGAAVQERQRAGLATPTRPGAPAGLVGVAAAVGSASRTRSSLQPHSRTHARTHTQTHTDTPHTPHTPHTTHTNTHTRPHLHEERANRVRVEGGG